MNKCVKYNVNVKFIFLDKQIEKTINYLIESYGYEMIIISLSNTSFDEMMKLAYWIFHNYKANNELSLYRFRLVYNNDNKLEEKIISFKHHKYWYFDQVRKYESRKEIKNDNK